jgi:hypothetical protein
MPAGFRKVVNDIHVQ